MKSFNDMSYQMDALGVISLKNVIPGSLEVIRGHNFVSQKLSNFVIISVAYNYYIWPI